MESDFTHRMTEFVNANLHNEHFGPEELAVQMGMSHSALHRKVKKVCNKTISRFIREKHLKKAELMNNLLIKIENDAPRIAKELQISDKLKDVIVKQIGSESSPEIQENIEESEKERKGFFAKIFSGKKKEEKDNN